MKIPRGFKLILNEEKNILFNSITIYVKEMQIDENL